MRQSQLSADWCPGGVVVRRPPRERETRGSIPRSDSRAGLVVKASASKAEDAGLESRLRRDFSGSSHTSD